MPDLIREIHDSGCKIVLAATGGGIGAIDALFTTPGASRSMLEAIVPYASESLIKLLGGKPDQFCSNPTARAMAMACFERAKSLTGEKKTIGVGCTASLASDQPKHGAHRVHVAVQAFDSTRSASLTLVKGRRSRKEEDEVASALLLSLLHSAAVGAAFDWSTAFDDEPVEHQKFDAPESWRRLLAGQAAIASGDGNASFNKFVGDGGLAIYPGAFHPLHAAHRKIAQIAESRGYTVLYEISIRNVDKPPLDFLEMASRAAQFTAGEELLFTNRPTFAEKARIFPGSTFLVGVDTILRISDPKYYGDETKRDAAIATLRDQGCRFLVFGRLIEDAFREFDPSEVVPELAALCDAVSEQEFRLDLSSTEIRQSQLDSLAP